MNDIFKVSKDQNKRINVLLTEIGIVGVETDQGVRIGRILLASVREVIAFKNSIRRYIT